MLTAPRQINPYRLVGPSGHNSWDPTHRGGDSPSQDVFCDWSCSSVTIPAGTLIEPAPTVSSPAPPVSLDPSALLESFGFAAASQLSLLIERLTAAEASRHVDIATHPHVTPFGALARLDAANRSATYSRAFGTLGRGVAVLGGVATLHDELAEPQSTSEAVGETLVTIGGGVATGAAIAPSCGPVAIACAIVGGVAGSAMGDIAGEGMVEQFSNHWRYSSPQFWPQWNGLRYGY